MRVCPVDNLSKQHVIPSTVADTAIAHGLVTSIAAVVSDTATCSGASAINIDLVNDAIFTFGAAGYDTGHRQLGWYQPHRSRTGRLHRGKGRRYRHRCRRWLR